MTQSTRSICLQRQPDGSYIDWGRHGPGRTGPALHYGGEDAEVLALLVGDGAATPIERTSEEAAAIEAYVTYVEREGHLP